MRRLLALCLLAGCTSLDQYQAAASSFRVGAYAGRISTDGSFSRTDKTINEGADSYGFTGSFAPFEYWNQKMQAEAIARAITEAQYREKYPVEAKPK